VHFGLGKTVKVDSIVVAWLDGRENVLETLLLTSNKSKL
jgi:hypothetical protein